jgi:hypothetical protein
MKLRSIESFPRSQFKFQSEIFIIFTLQAMKKHRFKIISYTKGDASFYETKVKTWLGWVSFTVFYKTDILHILSVPSVQKSMAYERISQYCEIKGYKKKNIEISEISKSENRRWIFFQRIYSDLIV